MKADTLDIVSDGIALAGEMLVPDEPRGIVVLLHGIPSIAPPEPDDEGYPGVARRVAAAGFAACWADMRATRSSPGFFSIEGWVRDARAVVDAARRWPGLQDNRLALVGSSGGGAVGVEVTVRGAPVDALGLLAAPASWVSIEGDARAGVQRITQLAGMEVAPEVIVDPQPWAAEFDTVTAQDSIGRIEVPILIVHGTDDIVVPVGHASLLAAKAPGARVEIIEGAEHQLRRDDRTIKILVEWLGTVLA